jgi:hypothetical protein
MQTRVAQLVAAREAYIKRLEKRTKRLSAINTAILFSDDFSDLVFEAAGGERLPAHRNIVAATSSVMRVLLKGQWADSITGVVRVEQSAAATRAMLRYMYTDEVDQGELERDLFGTFELASKYGQDGLFAACEEHARKVLTVKSVVPIIVTAKLYDLKQLKSECMELIKRNMAVVLTSTAFMKLKTKEPELWREVRVALGVTEEHDDDDDDNDDVEEEENDSGRVAKKPRLNVKCTS